MPKLAVEDGARNFVDFIDHLFPRQHMLVSVDLWRLSHRRALWLDQCTSRANEPSTAESPLVEILSIQSVGVCVVRPSVVNSP